MADMAPRRWFGSARELCAALANARSVHMVEDMHLCILEDRLRVPANRIYPQPRLFAAVERMCPSFSGWWKRTHILLNKDKQDNKR
jgi:deoxyribodipyrimidine photo-lyase